MRAILERVENVCENVTTFWFLPERHMRYVAGQYLDVYLPHANVDNRGTMRTMSLSSSPTEPLVGITTSFMPHGGSSFKRALLALKPGNQVMMTDPMGDFVLPKDPSIPVTFVAGGIGVVPVRSMIQWLIDTGEVRDVQIIYIARSPQTMPYIPVLMAYTPAQLSLVYTQAAPAGVHVSTRPNTLGLLQRIGKGERLIYLSGPQPMMETYWQELQQHGIPRERLVLDYFTGYTKL